MITAIIAITVLLLAGLSMKMQERMNELDNQLANFRQQRNNEYEEFLRMLESMQYAILKKPASKHKDCPLDPAHDPGPKPCDDDRSIF